MSEQNTDNTQAQTTADEQVNNTGASQTDSGAVADTAAADVQSSANTNQAQTKEKTFTQADVDRIVKQRLEKAVKQKFKELSADDPAAPDVNELQQQLKDYQSKARTFETKEAIRDYASDARNKLGVRAENMRAVEKLVAAEIEYGDDGQIINLKEAFETVKSEAPTLFINNATQINGNNGNKQANVVDMNQMIRSSAGYGA